MGNELAERLTTQGKAVAPAARSAVLEDARQLIPLGHTIAQIASKHGIAERTLEYWLADLGEEYASLRKLWIDNLLHEAGDLLKDTREDGNAPLRLARARELWKRATWYAERRDRARYGQDNPAGSTAAIQIIIGSNRTQRPADSAQVIDVTEDGASTPTDE